MLIAESEFVIVFEKLLRDKKLQSSVVAQSVTFIPKLGHCVNEFYRVRMPRGVLLQAVTAATPHFLRPLPPPQIMIPLSDSRRVDQSNVNRLTNKVHELPTVRPFQAVVHGIRDDGNNPEHGLPVSTYLSRSPMSLKESVAQVAMRFFSKEQLLRMRITQQPPATPEVTIEITEPQIFAETQSKQPLFNSRNVWHGESGRRVKEMIEANAIYNKHDYTSDCLPLMLPDGSTAPGHQLVLDILLKHIERNRKLEQASGRCVSHAIIFVLSNVEDPKSQWGILETLQERKDGVPLHERIGRSANVAFLFVTDKARWASLGSAQSEWDPVTVGKVSSVAVYNSQVYNAVKELTREFNGPPIANYANESHAIVYTLDRRKVVDVIPMSVLSGRLETNHKWLEQN